MALVPPKHSIGAMNSVFIWMISATRIDTVKNNHPNWVLSNSSFSTSGRIIKFNWKEVHSNVQMEEKSLKQWWITECNCVIGKSVTKVTVMNYVFSKPCKGNITYANITNSTQEIYIIFFLKGKKWAEGSLTVWLNCTMKHFSLSKNILPFFSRKATVAFIHSYTESSHFLLLYFSTHAHTQFKMFSIFS